MKTAELEAVFGPSPPAADIPPWDLAGVGRVQAVRGLVVASTHDAMKIRKRKYE
jgi:hypothetical protein